MSKKILSINRKKILYFITIVIEKLWVSAKTVILKIDLTDPTQWTELSINKTYVHSKDRRGRNEVIFYELNIYIG